MQSFYGSMTHSYNGKKRKTNAWKKVKQTPPEFKPLTNYNLGKSSEDHREKYPSVCEMKYTPQKDTSYKREESKKFTVAPAYNKGAYQVIPKDDVKHIGR